MSESTKQTDALSFEHGTSRDVNGPPGARSYAPVDQINTRRAYVGGPDFPGGQLERDTRRQPVMGDELVRMAGNLSTPQMQHGLIFEQRGGTSQKQVFADGTGHGALRSPSPSGRIRAVQSFGLGPAYSRPGPQDDTRADTPQTDYLRQPEGPLDKYVDAKSILGPGQDYGSGFPRTHELSQFPTMGMEMIPVLGVHPSVGPRRDDKGAGQPRSNRELGGQS